MKSDREFWFRIGQQMEAASQKKRAAVRESEHDRATKEASQEINPAIAPQMRAALEAAKNGKASNKG